MLRWVKKLAQVSVNLALYQDLCFNIRMKGHKLLAVLVCCNSSQNAVLDCIVKIISEPATAERKTYDSRLYRISFKMNHRNIFPYHEEQADSVCCIFGGNVSSNS
jgi:hypothetical protein